ncbi:hypothetical protein ABI023_14660, partial [Enterococcus faecium]|uniref:hypothetical protein n=1 Tax=Enterococcus faecium TaxID=1352 RepID=UPI003F42E0C9
MVEEVVVVVVEVQEYHDTNGWSLVMTMTMMIDINNTKSNEGWKVLAMVGGWSEWSEWVRN